MIFLIRHGEAAAGWGSHPDPGLSALGQRQADAVAEQLLAEGANAVVSSPMQRCRETAQPLATRLELTPQIEPAVSEIETPVGLEDRSAWLRQVMAGRWDEAGHDFDPWRRAALAAVSSLPDGTAVFSHFIAINAIVGLLEQREDVIVFRPGHTSVTVLEREGGGLVVRKRGGEAATRVL